MLAETSWPWSKAILVYVSLYCIIDCLVLIIAFHLIIRKIKLTSMPGAIEVCIVKFQTRF